VAEALIYKAKVLGRTVKVKIPARVLPESMEWHFAMRQRIDVFGCPGSHESGTATRTAVRVPRV
jgi:hypothetical protein